MRLISSLIGLVAILAGGPLAAETAVGDGLLSHFVGEWAVSGLTRGRATVTRAVVTPEFGGAFIALHVKDPTGANPYEARVFFGASPDGTVVVHWLDRTGGETSRTLGRGQIDGDVVRLDFPYPDGRFRDRLSYDRAADRWRLLIEMGPPEHPTTFSDWRFERAKAP